MSCFRPLAALAFLLVLPGGGCVRLADEIYDFEALKTEACVEACDTIDTCDPGRFVGREPDNCFDRCMTLLPKLHEENQCSSREIIYLHCLGTLTCEELAGLSDEIKSGAVEPDYTVTCLAETVWSCSEDEPFDPDEPVPERL